MLAPLAYILRCARCLCAIYKVHVAGQRVDGVTRAGDAADGADAASFSLRTTRGAATPPHRSTSPQRMEKHCENAMKVATHLSKHPKIEWVRYPGLSRDPMHRLQKRLKGKGRPVEINHCVGRTRQFFTKSSAAAPPASSDDQLAKPSSSASRRWRGGRCGDSGRTRREF